MVDKKRIHYVGQLQHPGGRSENVELYVNQRPNITDMEASASIAWVDSRFDPGYIERYGGVADGTTDSTTPFQKAVSVGRQDVKFWESGRTDVLNTYTGRHKFYILRDAYVAGNSVLGPANFASDGTQTNAILQLGRNPDWANGLQYKTREIKDIIFSGKQRVDSGCYILGNTGDITTTSGPQYTTGWKFVNCHFERMNKGIIKPEGNFVNYFYDCSSQSSMFFMWAEGRPETSIATDSQDLFQGGEYSGHFKAAFYYDGKQAGSADTEWHHVIIEDNKGFGIFLKDQNSNFESHVIQNCHFERNCAGLTVDADGIAASQTPGGAGDFTLDGALTSGGTYTADSFGSRQISFTSASDESGDSYTITGTIYDGSADTEVIVGPNATTVNSTKSWLTISQIATNGAATGAITIGVTNAVDLMDGNGPRTPRDIYVENVDGLQIKNCWLKKLELIDSTVSIDGCKFISASTAIDGTKFFNNDVATIGHVSATNVSLDGWGDNSGDYFGGAHLCTIESITRQNRPLGTNASHIMAPQRILTGEKPNNATVFESTTNQQGNDWLTDDGGSNVAGTPVAGLSFATATQYVFTTNAEWIAPATMAIPEHTGGTGCTEDNWLVTTLEVKIASGDTVEEFNLQIGGAGAVTRVTGMDIPEALAGEWVTIAAIGQVPSIGAGDGACRYHIKSGAATATVAFGAFQAVEFANAQDAIAYYNSKHFALNKQETTKTKKTSLPTRASNTTLADDTELAAWHLDPGTTYSIEGFLILDTDSTAEWKAKWDFSNAAQTVDILHFVDDGTVRRAHVDSGSGFTGVGGADDQYVKIAGLFKSNATTGGDVSFQWAQGVSDSYATRFEEGSWVTIRKRFNPN